MSNLIKNSADNAVANVILAHGAGAAMDSDFMNDMAIGLAENQINVYRFEFEYMAQRRTGGSKRPPPRVDKLIPEFNGVVDEINAQSALPIFIGGKSMGGRIATMLNIELSCAGVICLGYPFHPPGKPDKLRVDHLSKLKSPLHIVQGQRDTLGNEAEIASYQLSSEFDLVFLPDGDHSFKPRKSSGVTLQQNMDAAIQSVSQFVRQHV